MPLYTRVALFLDYENFHATLQKRTRTLRHRYGYSPQVDFLQLVDFIERNYGPLARRDFIAVANFTHYNPQKGGLNKVATLIDVDSFKPRSERSREQSSGGKKYVEKNYADFRLAYEIGKHVQERRADLYIIASGDGGFAAVGRALEQDDVAVLFLLAAPELSAIIIKEGFRWFDFDRTQTPPEPPAAAPPVKKAPSPPREKTKDEMQDLQETLSALRRALSTGVPLDLLKALLPAERSEALIRKAESQGLIDRWEAPESGVVCVSLRSERLFGKVQPIPTRPEVAGGARQLYLLAQIAADLPETTRAAWRRALKDRLGLSNRQVKALLQNLFAIGILRPADLRSPRITLETALEFLGITVDGG